MTDPAKLRGEWRGFLFGSLIVLTVSVFTIAVLITEAVQGQLAKLGSLQHVTLAQAYAATQTVLRANPPVAIDFVWLAGSIGLFILNYRFSHLLGRPRAMAPGAGPTGARYVWLAVNMINSMLFAYIVPELVMLAVFARWVRHAMREAAGPRPGTRSDVGR